MTVMGVLAFLQLLSVTALQKAPGHVVIVQAHLGRSVKR